MSRKKLLNCFTDGQHQTDKDKNRKWSQTSYYSNNQYTYCHYKKKIRKDLFSLHTIWRKGWSRSQKRITIEIFVMGKLIRTLWHCFFAVYLVMDWADISPKPQIKPELITCVLTGCTAKQFWYHFHSFNILSVYNWKERERDSRWRKGIWKRDSSFNSVFERFSIHSHSLREFFFQERLVFRELRFLDEKKGPILARRGCTIVLVALGD